MRVQGSGGNTLLKPSFPSAQEFVELLNSIRLGTCTEAMAETLQRTSNNRLNSGGLEAIKLFPTNAQVAITTLLFC